MFVLGCQDLIVITDHKPLPPIFKNKDLYTIMNPQLLKLKEKTLQYTFTIQYCPGKWHRTGDNVSRNAPKASLSSISSITELSTSPPSESLHEVGQIDVAIATVCDVSKTPPITNLLQWDP